MTGEIELKVTLERREAETLLETLDARLQALQRVEDAGGAELYSAAQREKAAIIPVILNLEAALKFAGPRH